MTEGAKADGGSLESFLEDWRALRPDLEPVGFSIIMHIRRLNLMLARIIDGIAAEHDLNDSDVRLLMAIKRDRGQGPVRPSDLSERLNLTRATITYRVDRFIELGLADRTADPSDRRALFVKLTPKGEQVAAEIMTRFAEIYEARLEGVDGLPGGRASLALYLRAMIAGFAGS